MSKKTLSGGTWGLFVVIGGGIAASAFLLNNASFLTNYGFSFDSNGETDYELDGLNLELASSDHAQQADLSAAKEKYPRWTQKPNNLNNLGLEFLSQSENRVLFVESIHSPEKTSYRANFSEVKDLLSSWQSAGYSVTFQCLPHFTKSDYHCWNSATNSDFYLINPSPKPIKKVEEVFFD